MLRCGTNLAQKLICVRSIGLRQKLENGALVEAPCLFCDIGVVLGAFFGMSSVCIHVQTVLVCFGMLLEGIWEPFRCPSGVQGGCQMVPKTCLLDVFQVGDHGAVLLGFVCCVVVLLFALVGQIWPQNGSERNLLGV